jgi:hypothetical protein
MIMIGRWLGTIGASPIIASERLMPFWARMEQASNIAFNVSAFSATMTVMIL